MRHSRSHDLGYYLAATVAAPAIGIPLIAAATSVSETNRILLEYPKLSFAQAQILGAISGTAQTATMALTARLMVGRMPATAAFLKSLEKPAASMPELLRRTALKTGIAMVEGGVQTEIGLATPMVVDGLAKAFWADMQGYDFQKKLAEFLSPDTQITALVPIAMVVAVGSGLAGLKDIKPFREIRQDPAKLSATFGIDAESALRVAEAPDNKKDAILREAMARVSPETNRKIGEEAQKAAERAQAMQAAPGLPTLNVWNIPNGTRYFSVEGKPGKEIYLTQDQDAALMAHGEVLRQAEQENAAVEAAPPTADGQVDARLGEEQPVKEAKAPAHQSEEPQPTARNNSGSGESQSPNANEEQESQTHSESPSLSDVPGAEKDLVGTSTTNEPAQIDVSKPLVPMTEEERAAAKASEERWWRVLQAVAPRMAAQFELRVASRAEAAAKFNHDVPAEAQAAIHKRVIYLFQEALEETGRAGNRRQETVRRLLHETAHAWWDTLSNADRVELERQWKSETSEKTGPLYVDGEIRPDAMAGVESDVQEWFAERVTHANDHWAQKKAAIADHDGSLLGRVSSHLRSWLFDGMEAIRSVGSRDRLVSEFRRVMRKKSPIADGEVRFAQPRQVSSAADVIKAANDDGNHGVYAELPFGDSDQQEMEHALGRPIRLSHRIIDSYGVRHVQKRHGAKSRDPFPVSDSDIERINEILHAPGVSAYAGRTPQGRDTILHVRKLGDWFYTLEEVRESKETLVLFAMRKAPARTSSAQKAPSLTSETLSHEASTRLQAAIEDFKQRHGPRFAQAKPGMKLPHGDHF